MRELVFKTVCLVSICLTQSFTEDEAIILTPLITSRKIAAAREESIVDKDLIPGIHSHSGFITVNEECDSNLFFWYFPHYNVTKVPWIIWLNGGPGDSSMIGLFEEIGPVKIEDGIVKRRNVTWASDYSLLFIDSPAGAGFSFTRRNDGYATSSEQVGEELYEFLSQFLEMFPEQKMAPLFIAGQSYAGKYAPALAMEIHRNRNKNIITPPVKLKMAPLFIAGQSYAGKYAPALAMEIHRNRNKNIITPPVKLKGISLGSPLIDPKNMMYYSVLTRELGLLQGDALEILTVLENSVVELVDHKSMAEAGKKFNETIEFIKTKSGVSIYNFLKDPTNKTSEIYAFLNKPDVRRRINVGTEHFDLHNQLVYEKMLPDIVVSSKPVIEELLNDYGVMCYHGQLDLYTPYGLSKRIYDHLQWKRLEEFQNAPRKRLRHYPDEKVVAFKKAGGNFMEIMIRGCGHMAPSEEPEFTKFIMDMFVNTFKNTPPVI
ncbi:serine carboxypeptidase domain-containing protein [Phthorimaea operculella]|nr:serine carboxypeptidase domain-containing protein [Phthorimaea operculella]